MTAYEITQDLLDSTTGANPSGPAGAGRRARTGATARLRAAVTGGLAVGALLLAAPVASAAVPAGPAHSAIAQGSAESTLPSTLVLTTRRTGSVLL